jgi:hypothetical protein
LFEGFHCHLCRTLSHGLTVRQYSDGLFEISATKASLKPECVFKAHVTRFGEHRHTFGEHRHTIRTRACDRFAAGFSVYSASLKRGFRHFVLGDTQLSVSHFQAVSRIGDGEGESGRL